ncbi:YggS family pyridoxal phosphate-dependent enzyme [Effusibacillus pohliae]|uniref:YggS family pyridoxal phosphate-dependent enzyme n=1 Tax=Effusibacillus pohliae TaxID=232270 RepID=UPI00037A5B91|nr:YggS family pyridoxal phosphate-dependent enzyme [Effusibacillus pohliae]
MDYREKIAAVRERIERACERTGRRPEEVTVIAVTKYVGVEETRAILAAGIRDLGENRVQQALPKLDAIRQPATWHFIGYLQTNKVKDVLPHFAWIHSLDRLSLAKELQKQAEKRDLHVTCLVQVNISGEPTKSGLPPLELAAFLDEIKLLNRIRVRGLMTMAPIADDPEQVRPVFRGLRELRDRLLPAYPELQHLSMGMSGDFEVAVEEGATMVRLGSILVKP